jgi:hypothetical protein
MNGALTGAAYSARTLRLDPQIAAAREVEGSVMHVQARSEPALSPPDLAAFLKVIGDDINIEGVTGCAVEDGGQIAFTVAHGQEAQAHDLLTGAGYTVQWTSDLYAEEIPLETANQPGVLAGIIVRAKQSLAGDRTIDTVLIGTGMSGGLYCQCTWTDATWQSEPPQGEAS